MTTRSTPPATSTDPELLRPRDPALGQVYRFLIERRRKRQARSRSGEYEPTPPVAAGGDMRQP